MSAARRFRFLGDPFIDTANMLVYYLLLPALLFYKIGTSNFREAFNAPLVIGGYAATVATFLLAVFLSRALGISPAERGSFVQGAFRANLAYVGLPIVLSAVGDIGLRAGGSPPGFPVLVEKALESLSSAALPLSLLCLGGAFSFEKARSGVRLAALAAGMKTLLLTALAVAPHRWMGISGGGRRGGG